MGGFAYECDPLVREAPRRGEMEGKQTAPGFEFDLAKDGMRSTLDFSSEVGVTARRKLVGLGRIENPNETRSVFRQRYKCKRTG